MKKNEAREQARQKIVAAMENVGYRIEEDDSFTEQEKEQIWQEFLIQRDRIYGMFGYQKIMKK